jgi:hypothetical protein
VYLRNKPLIETWDTSRGATLHEVGDDFVSWLTSLGSLETRKSISRPTPTGAEEFLDAALYEVGDDSFSWLTSTCCPETFHPNITIHHISSFN